MKDPTPFSDGFLHGVLLASAFWLVVFSLMGGLC